MPEAGVVEPEDFFIVDGATSGDDGNSGLASGAPEIAETDRIVDALSSTDLTEAWLSSIVANYSAADQALIDHAITTSAKKGVPETSNAINEAKTALMGCHDR